MTIVKGGLIAAMVVLLVASVAAGTLQFSFAKSKVGKVRVTVLNFRADEKRVEYQVFNAKTGDVIGKRVFDFWAHEIEADEPSFVLPVSFNTKGLHTGNKLSICVDELDFGDAGYCSFKDVTYKKGKTLHVTIDMSTIVGVPLEQ